MKQEGKSDESHTQRSAKTEVSSDSSIPLPMILSAKALPKATGSAKQHGEWEGLPDSILCLEELRSIWIFRVWQNNQTTRRP